MGRIFRASALCWRTPAGSATAGSESRPNTGTVDVLEVIVGGVLTGPNSEEAVDVFVDECDAGLVRRGGGLVTMGPIADDATEDPRRSHEDFASALGLVRPSLIGTDMSRRLWIACAGRVGFAASVLEVAAAANVPVEPESPSFADWAAGLCPRLRLSLGPGDETAAAVLAQLSAVSQSTAVRALTAVAGDLLGGNGISDSEGVIARLCSSGILSVDDSHGRQLRVPILLAAKLRHDFRTDLGSVSVVDSLLEALIEHLESAGPQDAALLGDVLLLARRGSHWTQLLRVAEAVGLPVFLLAPREACTAFGLLPSGARAAESGLEFFGTLADDIASSAAELSPDGVRVVVAAQTGPGMLRSRLPGTSSDNVCDGSEAGGCIGAVQAMIGLADAGRHNDAAVLGLRTSATISSVRAKCVIRLLTAVALHHAAQSRRALSILHEIEAPARAGHVDGDFLLPAVTSWTALISAISGDHERADASLLWPGDRPRAVFTGPGASSAEVRRAESATAQALRPTVVDELVSPASCIASALRALDRLDLARAASDLDALASYPEKRTLWVYLPVIARTIAILSAEAESGLLVVNDDAEQFRDSGVLSVAERDLLALSRSMVFIALGQLRWAEIESERLSTACDSRIVLDIRSKLVAGRCSEAIQCADTWFYHRSLRPRSRAELAAIRAAARQRLGDEDAAREDFAMAVSLSTWVSSLLPLALLPQADRSRLIDLTADAPVWSEAAAEFATSFGSADELIDRLRNIGPVSVEEATMPQLSAGEAQLIELLAGGLSVAEIAAELNVVTGTVKNRLSVLYRKFGVTSRAEALGRARSYGFLARS